MSQRFALRGVEQQDTLAPRVERDDRSRWRYPAGMEFVLFTFWALYFLPFGVSAGRDHEHHLPILIFNALTGWTGVGWVLALIWALNPSSEMAPVHGGAAVIPLRRATGPG